MEAIELKKLLSQARERCPGMDEIDYQLADYLVANLSDWVNPSDTFREIFWLLDNIESCRYDRNTAVSTCLPDMIRENCNAALMNAPHLLRIIGAVSEPEFNDELRSQCERMFGWNPAWEIHVAEETKIPDLIKKVVDSCAKWIRKNESSKTNEDFTEDELCRFRSALTELMVKDLKKYSPVILSFWHYGEEPHSLLKAAARIAGIKIDRAYPLNADFDFQLVITQHAISIIDCE